MKVLVTGGTGFIGSRLALASRQRGLQVAVSGQVNTVPERARARELDQAGVELLQGALQDAAYAQRLVQGCDWVIHLAAAQHEANVPDSYFESANIGGTRTLLEASRAAGVKRFVYGSTIGVYGEASTGRLDESSPARPMNVYG
ncbi:MAG TPA: NAD-dependent epimerase/dehydratase family protein, partial [Steroidobacteraceae bacterium]